ncbi:MAG TPA: hypothetical protein VFG69_02540, partial [Nannocystaceae bacterium]|nr:hypothetical protein [Nannocystaceae bacterium]
AGSTAPEASPIEAAPQPEPPPEPGEAVNAEVICATYAEGYCEPGDASPAAINPGMREFVVLDCKKRMLDHPDHEAVKECVDTTKECGAMGECLESGR